MDAAQKPLVKQDVSQSDIRGRSEIACRSNIAHEGHLYVSRQGQLVRIATEHPSVRLEAPTYNDGSAILAG